MSFNMLVGGSPIEELPIIKKQIESNNVILDHWNNCKWKSDKQLVKVNRCCGGGNQETEMYVCNLLGTQDLNPLICERCGKFEKKEENI